MKKSLRGELLIAAVLAIPFTAWGCGRTGDSGPSAVAPAGGPVDGSPQGTVPPAGFQGGDPQPGRGVPGGAADSGIKQIMRKLDKGPNSLSTIDKGLKANSQAWETIQPQTAEYARLTADLGKSDPPKGTKESWTKLTSAYAESAAALDKAAQAKDLNAATAAHRKLATSCMECHREHRGGRGGFGPGGQGERGPGPAGFSAPPQSGQILAPYLQDRLKLTSEQKKLLEDLQKEVDSELGKILTDEQMKQSKEPSQGFGPGGPGPFGPPGGFGGDPPGGGERERPQRPD